MRRSTCIIARRFFCDASELTRAIERLMGGISSRGISFHPSRNHPSSTPMPWFSRMVSRRRTRSSSVSRSARVAGAGVAVGTGADEGATETALYGPRGSVSLIAFFRSFRRNSSARNACAVSSFTFASCSERVEKSSVETLICFGHDSEGFVALPSGGFTAGSNGVEDAERAVAASTRATPGETGAASGGFFCVCVCVCVCGANAVLFFGGPSLRASRNEPEPALGLPLRPPTVGSAFDDSVETSE
mmetsp:Transcript_14124/g.59510  ORF Transcript_14124/g.59510 Transcript_14124/m.59510 type:complete len:246 (-) Transcript_14124:426-1163(-)